MFPRLLDSLQTVAPQAEVTAVYGSRRPNPSPVRPVWICDRKIGGDGYWRWVAGRRRGSAARLRIRWTAGGSHRPSGPEFKRLCLGLGQTGEIVVSGSAMRSRDTCAARGIAKPSSRWTGKFACTAIRPRTRGNLALLGRCTARINDRRGVLYPFTVETAASNFTAVRRGPSSGRRQTNARGGAGVGFNHCEFDLLKSKLAWAHIERLLVLPRIPVDRRHNAKVDYPGLDRILKRLERITPQPAAG